MKQVLSSTGIVLKRFKVGEADVMLRMLLENGEAIQLKVHGILASKKRSSLMTEPGALVSLTYYFHDEKPASLKEGSVLDQFLELKTGYFDMLILSHILELSEYASRGEKSPDLFVLLKGALGELREQKGKGESSKELHLLFLGFYKVRILKLLGLLGETDRCSMCGETLGETAHWNVPEVDFNCGNCSVSAGIDERLMAAHIEGAAKMRFANFRAAAPAGDMSVWERRLGECLETYFAAQMKSGPLLYKELGRI